MPAPSADLRPGLLPDRRLGLVLVTASAVAWSTTGLFTRILDLDTATMLVWRGAFGALGLFAVLLAMEGRAGLSGFLRLGRAGWLYAGVSAAGMLLFIGSLAQTTVAHVAVIYAAVPFLAAGLGWLILSERPSRSAVLASAVALAGAALMVGLGREGSLLGDLMALGMTLAMALMMVIARRNPEIPTLAAACLSGLLSAALCLPFAGTAVPGSSDLMILAAFGIVNSALGLSLFLAGSRHLPPVETALITALDAPLAPIWVWLAFSETPSLATLAGGTLVMVAVVAHILQSAREAPSS